MEGKGSASNGASNGNGVVAAAATPAAAAPALKALIDLSETIASQPERFATGVVDAGILEQSDRALKGVFGHALESESLSLPYIGHLLRETIGVESTPATTRSSSSSSSSSGGKKRKRQQPQKHTPYHSLFPPTPLEGLVLNDVGEEAVWQQLEYRNQAVEDVLGKILVTTGAMPEDDEENDVDEEEDELAGATPASDEVDKKKRKKRAKGQGAAGSEEEIINDLSSLSDADLRAIGVDPAMRSEAIAAAQARRAANGDDDLDSDDDFSPDEDEEEEEEGMFPDGYPGASDYSSDEEDEEGGGGAGSSKRVYYEPLRTEREQRRKKEEDERRELQRVRMLSGLRGSGGGMGEDDSEGEEDDDEDDDYGLEDDSEEEDEEEEEDAPTSRPSKRSILDSLDDETPGSSSASTSGSGNRRRHPTLDDDFFSIDEFNRQTEEQERREIFKEAANSNADGEDEEEDVDMFQAFSDDDDKDDEDGDAAMAGAGGAADLRYADFFEPPPNRSGPSQRGGAQKRAKGKGKGSRVGQGAKLAKQERDARAADAEDDESDDGDAGADGVDDFEALGLDKVTADDDDSSDGEDETQPARPNTRVRFAPQVAIRNIKARPNKGLEDGELGEITPELLKALQEQDGDESGSEDDDDDDASEDDGMSEDGSDDDDDGNEEEDDSDTADASEDGQSIAFDEEAEQETARRFAGDLFADNSDDDDAPQDANGSSSSTARISAHERRLTSLQAEIARLESENVAAKDWTLSGEASSRARPKDSLLEQDLEFEQTSRPTPTITIDKTEALEELIKRRILENRFDDVVARRVFAQPEYKPEAELSDRKSGKSLAEEYEEDLRRKDSGAEAPRSETERKLDAERTAIAGLMDDLFDKLDALSNAHFTPRAPKAAITTLSSSAPAIAMEGAATTLPGTAHLPSQLAAHEVLDRGEVEKVMRGAGGELSHEEKQALHRRKKRAAGAKRDADEVAKGVKAMNEGAGKKVASGSGSGSGEQKAGGGDKKEKKGPSAQQKEKDEAMKKLLGMRGVTVVGKGSGKGEKKAGGSGAGGKGKEVERRGEGFKL